MTNEEFAQWSQDDSNLTESLRRVAVAIPGRQFSTMLDAAAVAALYPIVRFVLVRIGLPWLHTTSRWSELKRQEVERWLDEQYEERGFDIIASEAATKALCAELERISGADARTSWEMLRNALKASSEEKPDDDAKTQSS